MHKYVLGIVFILLCATKASFAISDTSPYEPTIYTSNLPAQQGDPQWQPYVGGAPLATFYLCCNGSAVGLGSISETVYRQDAGKTTPQYTDVSASFTIPSGYPLIPVSGFGINLRNNNVGVSSSNNTGYDIMLALDSKAQPSITISKFAGSSSTTLQKVNVQSASGTLRAEIIGETINAYFNGALVASVYDTTTYPAPPLPGPAYVGISGFGTSPFTYGLNNFQISDASGFRKWVDHAYEDLNYTATPPQSSFENSVLNYLVTGPAPNNTSFTDAANGIEGFKGNPFSLQPSATALWSLVGNWYYKFLRRAPDSAGQQAWYSQLLTTLSQTSLANFLAGPEYQNYAFAHQTGPDNTTKFIKQIFNDLLHRAPTQSEINFYHSYAIFQIVTSLTGPGDLEFMNDVITCYYTSLGCWSTDPYPSNFLRRTALPSSSEVSYWVSQGDLLSTAIRFAGSQEYYTWASNH